MRMKLILSNIFRFKCFCFILIALILGTAILMMPGCKESVDSQKTWELKYWTPNHQDWWQGEVDQRFIDSVKKSTDGRVIITPYWAESLAPGPEALSLLKNGVCHIGALAAPLFPGEFPVSDVVSLPFFVKSSSQALKILKTLYEEGLMPEYNVIKLCGFRMTDMVYLMLREKEVTTLEDLKGLKIRVSPGIANETLPLLGAIPVGIKPPDLYLSVERGVVDGLISSPGFMGPFKMYEVGRVFVDQPLWVGINFLGMHQETWDSFPDDIKKIMEKEFAKVERDWEENNNKQEDINKDFIREKGVKFVKITPSEFERWKKVTQPVINKFVKKLNDAGLKGDKVIEIARKIVSD